MSPAHDRRDGRERRSGADRRNRPTIGRRHNAPAVAGLTGTVATYAAAAVSAKYGVPLEVTAPLVGLIFGFLAALYNRFALPWLD